MLRSTAVAMPVARARRTGRLSATNVVQLVVVAGIAQLQQRHPAQRRGEQLGVVVAGAAGDLPHLGGERHPLGRGARPQMVSWRAHRLNVSASSSLPSPGQQSRCGRPGPGPAARSATVRRPRAADQPRCASRSSSSDGRARRAIGGSVPVRRQRDPGQQLGSSSSRASAAAASEVPPGLLPVAGVVQLRPESRRSGPGGPGRRPAPAPAGSGRPPRRWPAGRRRPGRRPPAARPPRPASSAPAR